MRYQSAQQWLDHVDLGELPRDDERDGCYTWCYPLHFGPFDVTDAWRPHATPTYSNKLTLYCHIPFCQFVCSMCPFTHEPLKRRDLTRYVRAMIAEVEAWGGHPDAMTHEVSTLYFGGGTASSLSTKQVGEILAAIGSTFRLAPDCEITLECHPRTVDERYLAEIHAHGVNRVSFGVQSLIQKNIASLRLHQLVDQSKSIVETAVKTGFRSVAIDLMYRFSDQDVAELDIEIDEALALGVHCLSLYSLDPEIRNLESVKARQASIEVERQMYEHLRERMRAANFDHIAQPDYAKPGHHNRQVLDLWGAPQALNLSFGAGSFSQAWNGCAWANIHNSDAYIQAVERGYFPVAAGLRYSRDDAMVRYPALGVRCLEVPLRPFHDVWGIELTDVFAAEIERLVNLGWVTVQEDALVVTAAGEFFIDNISKRFYSPANRARPQPWGEQLRNLVPVSMVQRDTVSSHMVTL